MFTWMKKIAHELDFELVMVTNQDGLGTAGFPLASFQPVHDFIMTALENENIFTPSVKFTLFPFALISTSPLLK